MVNLPYRTDRRAEFCDQLARLGIGPDHPQIRFFPAIRPTDADAFPTVGARGCFPSHMKIVEQAVAEGHASVIICEHDLDFSADFASRLPGVLRALDRVDWDMFMAGYASDTVGDVISRDPLVFRVPRDLQLIGAHFYILRGRAIARLYQLLQGMQGRPPGHPEGGPMHYDGALNHFRSCDLDIVTVATLPALGVQRASRTDIHPLALLDRLSATRPVMTALRKVKRRLTSCTMRGHKPPCPGGVSGARMSAHGRAPSIAVMKMQNSRHTHRDAGARAVNFRPGTRIDPRDRSVEFEA